MKKIERIPTGTLGNTNSVFVAFYTDPVEVYRGVSSIPESVWDTKVALLGAVVRWDGSMGFPGGKVENGEHIAKAAARECFEEVGFAPDPWMLNLLCSHRLTVEDDGKLVRDMNIHLYTLKVSMEDIYTIRRMSTESLHGRGEAAGFNVMHMGLNTIANMKQMKWAGSGAQELDVLLEQTIQNHWKYCETL